MEHQKLMFQSLLVSILAIALIRIIRFYKIRPKARLPPGPWNLPVIGSMHHLVNVLPHHALRDLARVHGPLMMLGLGEVRLVVVSSREMARQVLKTHDANFATRPKVLMGENVLYRWADIVFSPSGDYWRKLRQLCAAEVLSPKRVLTFRHIREQEVCACSPSAAMFYNLAISIVSRASFGNKQRNADEFLAAMKAGAALASGFKIPDLFPTWRPVLAAVTGMRRTLEDVHRTVDSTLEAVIEERRHVRDEKARSGNETVEDENLVDILIGLHEKGSSGFYLNRNSVKAIIFDMFAAGTGTLQSSLDWAMSELMRNERVKCKLQHEIREAFRGKADVTEVDIQGVNLPYLKLVIKETLWLHPPVPLLVPRESIDACEIEGYKIPARSRVIVNAWALGRDPKYWDDADEFKPERFENNTMDFMGSCYEYIPFGAGRRMCPGISYGLPVLEMALVQLLYHFNWSLPEGISDVDMTEAPGIGVRRKLYQIRPKPRLPPGPWNLPVIGSMHYLVNVLPHHALRDLARVHGPLMMLRLGEVRLVVVSSREVARQVLRTHDANFATRPKLLAGKTVLYGWADILFSPSGDYWRKLRQLCAAEVLSPKRVLTFRHILDLSSMFLDLAISVVSRASFGKKLRNAKEYLSAINTAVTLANGFKIPDLFPTLQPVLASITGMRHALEDVHKVVDATLEEIIEERRRVRDEKQVRCGGIADADADENLVDVLIASQERGGLGFNLNKDSIKAIIFDMFTAGTRTLASTLSWGMSELMRNERVMDQLQGEIREAFRGMVSVTEADLQTRSLPYLKLVIKETLRLHPPVPLLVPRESVESCEIEGYVIPARSRVIVNVWAIGRDKKYWGDDADEFKPERFKDSTVDFMGSSYEFLPFGAGRRICPGIAYGLPVLEMVLVQLLYHFDWSLPEGTKEVDMIEAPGLDGQKE
ncbi:hypothetical protein HU200_018401 [Digitaria exilis]|uniref:Cytochrome P450 n=1 Tax=Digitaria exilis TaxID=1010633 RepID=A0A835F476_9POAL|nr:hypothetical protein HU200_018401 [Digitaria exilis]